MKYAVTFIRYYEYLVEADDEYRAKDIAADNFQSEMRALSTVDTSYDDCTVEEIDD